MKTLLLALFLCLLTSVSFSQISKVQVIHNSADLALAEVDVYLNGVLALDNFPFRNSTPFLDVPSGLPIEVAVAPGNSTSSADAVITETITFEDGETYVIVANGIFSTTGYDPAPPLSFQVYDNGREAAGNSANVDVLVHHGSTDAPTVDIVETQQGAGTLVDDISYSDFQGYLELPTQDYTVEIRDETGNTGIVAYLAPLLTGGFQGNALTVVASGFLDPSQNSNGPAFGLWAAEAAGGPLLELLTAPLGVEEFDVVKFTIYPNPAKNSITVNGEGLNLEKHRLTVTDIQGRLISEFNLDLSNNVISVSSLAAGIYQVNLFAGSKLVNSQKLIKE